MRNEIKRWGLGITYIVAVATIWIAASFLVQSVVDSGVSPFFITYLCNSLFFVYIPIIEVKNYLEDLCGNGTNAWFWSNKNTLEIESSVSEEALLIGSDLDLNTDNSNIAEHGELNEAGSRSVRKLRLKSNELVDEKGRWTRTRVAKVSLLICPFWFLAQLTFNLSLKYTTVTSNTILSSSSSLFTFLVSLVFLGEKFTWLKCASVCLCMGGTVIVSLSDSTNVLNVTASNPIFGDIFALVSACLYAIYVTLIRKNLPDDDDQNSGHASMAQFLGFMGLFNFLIFLPVVFVLNFTTVEPFYAFTWKQLGLIVGKGLLDNVVSDYLWVKAVLLTSTTVATVGLTIQVPLAAIVDSIAGHSPEALDYIGAVSIILGFVGINIPNTDHILNSKASDHSCISSLS